MPGFDKGGGLRTPFGVNQYLRSTKGLRFDSATVAKDSVPSETIDGNTEKILQPGEIIAKITSGADSGKFGPFQAGATDGRQTAANIVGINDTFLPWQLKEFDREVAVLKAGEVKQAWCFERDAGGARIPLSNATRDAIIALPALRALVFS